MPQQTFYVNISDFGSIAGANPFKSRDEILVKYWCKSDPLHAFDVLRKSGYITETDEEVPIAENIDDVKKEFQIELERKRPSNQADAEKIKEKYAKKISEAGKKDNLNDETVQKIQQNLSSDVNKKCGENTEKTILDNTEKKSGIEIRKRNSRMYYKTIYEDKNYKFLIGGKVDGISNSDLIVEAKYRTRESNVRKNHYDYFQLLGYLFVTGKSKGKIVQKYGDKIWDSDVETEKEWGIVEINENKSWAKFLNMDLFSFFECIKEGPTNFSTLEKPFLAISQGKFYPISGIGETEHFLINTFRSLYYMLPMSCQPSVSRNIKKSNIQQVKSSAPNQYALKECSSSDINNLNKKESPERSIPTKPNGPIDTKSFNGQMKSEECDGDTSLCEKFECKIPNHFNESPLKETDEALKNYSLEDDSPSLLLISDTILPPSLGGTPVKKKQEEEELVSPILIEMSKKRTSSPILKSNPDNSNNDDVTKDSVETASLSDPSLESNLSEFIEAGNIAEISTDFNDELENKEIDSIENEIFTPKDDSQSITDVSSIQTSVGSDISEFLEAGNVAEISSDFMTTLDGESDFDIESD